MSNAALTIETFVEPSFGENAYVVSAPTDPAGKVGWIIDPSFSPQVDDLLEYIRREHIRVERIVLTHGHLDHIAGVDIARQAYPEAHVAMPADEWAALNDATVNLSAMMGMPVTLETRADEDLPAGGEIQLGGLAWRILDVSGHSPAGRALYCPSAGVVFSGDSLFQGSIGRYDFPGSNGRRLLANIRENLLRLPGETAVYSGHGPPTTIQNEQKYNPYVSD